MVWSRFLACYVIASERTLGLFFRLHGLRTLTYQPSGTWADRSTKYKVHVHILYSLSMWIQCKSPLCGDGSRKIIKELGLITAKMLFIQKTDSIIAFIFICTHLFHIIILHILFLKNTIHFQIERGTEYTLVWIILGCIWSMIVINYCNHIFKHTWIKFETKIW